MFTHPLEEGWDLFRKRKIVVNRRGTRTNKDFLSNNTKIAKSGECG